MLFQPFVADHDVDLSCVDASVGCMEDGTDLGDVQLPPWAKGDPQEFIRIQREVSGPFASSWPGLDSCILGFSLKT